MEESRMSAQQSNSKFDKKNTRLIVRSGSNLPVRAQVCLGREPVESRLGSIFSSIGDISSVVPIARFDSLAVYGNYARPRGATTSSVRDNLEVRSLDLVFTAYLCQPVLPRRARSLLL